MVEISVTYGETRGKGETRSVDYQSQKHSDSETHELSINISLTKEQLLERSIEQWYFYYNNMLKKAVREMFGIKEKVLPEPEKRETETIAYENTDDSEIFHEDKGTAVKDPTNVIYGSVKIESEKALLIIDAKSNREVWIPKSCLKSGDKDSTKFVVHDWFLDNIKWSEST